MNITQRQAALVLLAIPPLLGWVVFLLWFQNSEPLALLFIFLSASLSSILFYLYWRRCWEPSRHLSVIHTTIVVAVMISPPAFANVLPIATLLPPILALILLEPGWIVVTGLTTLVIAYLRLGPQGGWTNPLGLLTYGVMLVGLVVGRVIADTARRKAAAQARLAEAQADELRQKNEAIRLQASLLDRVGQVVIAGNMGGAITYWNDAAETVYDWSAAEVIGRNLPEVITPRVSEAETDLIRTKLKAGQTWTGEVVVHRRDQSHYPALVTFSPLMNDSDSVTGWIGIITDITERKKIEAQIEQTNEQLRQEIKRRAQLEEQIRQTQKLEAVGKLAGGMAHDFNNLLVPMIGYADLSLQKLPPEHELYTNLIQIKKAAERAAKLIRQILAFSRQQFLEMRLLDLNEVVGELQQMLPRLIREDIELRTALTPELCPVRADKAQIEQILMNLVVNARDAMPHGGKLALETAQAYLDEAYLEKHANIQPGHYIMLAVSDTGYGMDAETKQHIFEPFFTTKEVGQGTGLGLATVFGIVKQHQGHIWVYSEPGIGTTFKIYFPRAENIEQPNHLNEGDIGSVSGTETVLVVEDEAMIRQLVCDTLKVYGYTVLEAPTPTEALSLASTYQNGLDLLLTDVIMPQMNGRELHQHIAVFRPHLKVLYMSGYTSDIIVHHHILDEETNFLQKPFTTQTLLRKIKMVLNRSD